MKKLLLLTALLVSVVGAASAQAFDSSSRYVGLSVGLFAGIGAPISVSYEQAVTDNIGVGGIIGYSGESESYSTGDYKYNNYLFGVRGNYHFDFVTNDRFDVYAGLLLGYNAASATYTWNSQYSGQGLVAPSASAGGVVFGVHIGGRYLINDRFAAFAELGYGLGVISLGATYSF